VLGKPPSWTGGSNVVAREFTEGGRGNLGAKKGQKKAYGVH